VNERRLHASLCRTANVASRIPFAPVGCPVTVSRPSGSLKVEHDEQPRFRPVSLLAVVAMTGSETLTAYEELVRSLVVERFRQLPRQARAASEADRPTDAATPTEGDHVDQPRRRATRSRR
jgi:hypothetical protein